MKRLYSDTIINQTPRLLSLLDRNPFSNTYGCFDRCYWHSKLTDFPSARFQEASLTLALLYQHSYPKNPYYNRPKVEQWSLAAVKYWQKNQSTNGSFSEWYPHEHSFVATAFTLYAITETVLVLKHSPSKPLLDSIKKSANWLTNQPLNQVSNQQAGAILALHNTYLITKNTQYRRQAQKKLTYLLNTQSSEGWFPEYNGADIGYSSVLLDYLAKYYQKTKNSRVLKSLKQLNIFLSHFVHPNYSFGGNYGSRNTQYLLPDGLEIIKSNLSEPLIKSFKKYSLNLDDRYLCYNGYSFLQAYQSHDHKKPSSFKFQTNATKHFPKAGFFVKSTPHSYLVINLKKGGSFKLYSKKNQKLIAESSGIIGKLTTQQIVSSNWLDQNYQIKVSQNQISLSGKLHYLKQFTSSPLSMVASRIFQTTLGRNQSISNVTKQILRKILITDSNTVPISFKTVFTFNREKLTYSVKLKIHDQSQFKSLALLSKFSHIYVPSSRFFHPEELDLNPDSISPSKITKLNQSKIISLSFSF